MVKRYEVTGACITHIPVSTSQGPMLVTLYKGAALPADVPEDRVKHLLDSNLIAEVKGAEPAAAEPAESDAEEGAGASPSVNSRSSKAELVEYGVAHDGDRAVLDAMTRDQLLDKYVRQQP